MQTLYNGDAISKQALDNAEARAKAAVAALNRARATHRMSDIGFRREDIDAAEAQLESLRVQLENAEYNLAQATLIAPEDGVIPFSAVGTRRYGLPCRSGLHAQFKHKKMGSRLYLGGQSLPDP